MSAVAIKVENVSKLYRLGEVGTGSLNHDLNRLWARLRGKEDPYSIVGETNDRTTKGKSDFVWSLKDVSFEVKQGEVMGIIGRNGAGKSTLLKILSKITAPTTGSLKMRGRIASLLEVGTGFHPELTGRENIFLNGAILGMSKAEIRSKFDEIVDFSGVERYIDTPVKRYSSGMYVRLAFAVAAFLEPEILIVDEVLAVGDAEFQKKCLGRMKDVSVNDGRTVLFVSHNLTAVQSLCNQSIYMERGILKSIGDTDKIVNNYLGGIGPKMAWSGVDGDGIINIFSTKVYSNNNPMLISDDISIELEIEVTQNIPDVVIGFNIVSVYGHPLTRVMFNDHNDLKGLSKGKYKIKFLIPKYSLATGTYSINFDVAIPHVKVVNSENINLSFELISNDEIGNRFFIQNSTVYNSIVRPNWYSGIDKQI